MKKLIVVFLFVAQVLLTGVAIATPVSVDFSVLTDTIDITNTAGETLNGVTFRYDDFGSGIDFASVDPTGVYGTPAGALILDFSTPATALTLNFELLDAISSSGDGSQIPYSLVALFTSNGELQGSMSMAADFFAYDPGTDPTLGTATGLFNYQGLAFDQAVLYFSPDAALLFTVSNVSYTPAPVPEPATLVLMATGLFGLVGWQRRRRQN